MTSEWADFLNPDVARTRLLRTGLFLVAHKMLLSSVKDCVHHFFSNTWTAVDGWKLSLEYREKVLSLDPKGRNDPFRASIAWLRQIEAINDHDETTIRNLTEERNRLAHELRYVLGGTIKHDFEGLFPKLVSLIIKIDRWWILNVEIETDPNLIGKEFTEHQVIPGSLMLLQDLNQIVLGQDHEAWAFYQ